MLKIKHIKSILIIYYILTNILKLIIFLLNYFEKELIKRKFRGRLRKIGEKKEKKI